MLGGEFGAMLDVRHLEESVELFGDNLGFGCESSWDHATQEVYEDWAGTCG